LLSASRGALIEPLLRARLDGAAVRVADSPGAIKRTLSEGTPRFDLVVADLTWDDYRDGFHFDGLDVLKVIRQRDLDVPVIFTVRGSASERDHVDEATTKPHVAGFCLKEFGPELLAEAIATVLKGGTLTGSDFPSCGNPRGVTSINDYFNRGQRGSTAARMAGAIASGRVVNAETLERVTRIPPGTAARPQDYLGPLIRERGEHPGDLRITQGVLYRWCGEHARYILSWCRRNGLGQISDRENY